MHKRTHLLVTNLTYRLQSKILRIRGGNLHLQSKILRICDRNLRCKSSILRSDIIMACFFLELSMQGKWVTSSRNLTRFVSTDVGGSSLGDVGICPGDAKLLDAGDVGLSTEISNKNRKESYCWCRTGSDCKYVQMLICTYLSYE
jgi:hypothetical protein